MPVMNAVGTSRPAPRRSGSAPTSIAVGSCQLGPPKPSAPDPDGARGLGRVRRSLLAEELGDRDLLGGLWRRSLRLDPHLVPDGLGEVVGRGLDGLDVRRVLESLRQSLHHDLDRLRLLDQLGDTRLVAGEVDVPSRAGLDLLDVVSLRRGPERNEPASPCSPSTSASGGDSWLANGSSPTGGSRTPGSADTASRPRYPRIHSPAARVPARRLVAALRARRLLRTLALGRLGPVDVLDRREELVEILEEVLALAVRSSSSGTLRSP
jgi:hypothetical protein